MVNRRIVLRVCWVLGIAVVATVSFRLASANNFEVYSGKKGCASIVNSDVRSDCETVQRRKNELCNVEGSCDFDKQKRQIEDYNAAKDKLKTINDSDRNRLEETIRDLKAKLDIRKSEAPGVMKIAQACIDGRAAVQEWFARTGISTTERARDDALRLRASLLDKLKGTDERRKVAKERRDAKPDDSILKDEYEKAASAYRDVEKELEAFNDKYGRDVERHADRLIRQYNDEKDYHDDVPTKQAKERLRRCKDLESLSY